MTVPIDPCGRAVDMLRSCYSTGFRFGRGSGHVSKITWYWCGSDAEKLPFPTPFASRNYVEKGVWPELGEVEGASRPWRNGSFPVFVEGNNPPCGSAMVWQYGYPGTVPPLFPRNVWGLLPCCGVNVNPIAAGQGELALAAWVRPFRRWVIWAGQVWAVRLR